MNPIFKTSYFGNQAIVYPDRFVFKKLWGLLGETVIPIDQIASVSVSSLLFQTLIIETVGGNKFEFYFTKAKELRDAILEARQIRML